MADLSRFVPTPAQMEALGAAFERVGHAAREATDNMVEAFAAAARRLELLRWERAEARREAQWHLQQEKNIFRQQIDRDTSHFGRKRRWRRARGRRIEARREMPRMVTLHMGQAYGKSKALRQRLMRSHCADAARFLNPSLGQPWAAVLRTMKSPLPYDEADGFPPNPEEEKFSDVLEELSAACRSHPSRQQQERADG